ncbi:hypothetical protein [Neobacillus mesonae]|uniref:hypothetical protein n=1 Tax=Neobacillus mesonae TaxID=1193713 RepID=UPI00082CEEB9|nr:hypothetical protein [Neobacillus mesonae]
MSNNRLKRYSKEVLEHIGYEPISNQIKPVHIANGLFRHVIGEEYNIKSLNEWSKRFSQGKEVNSADKIKDEYLDILDEDVTLEELNELRYFIELIFNADNAATPSLKFSTLTIASKTQVTKAVQNEFGIPKFLYKILSAKVNGEVSPCLSIIKQHLNNEDDEISRLAQPLVSIDSSLNKEVSFEENDNKLTGIELRIRNAYDTIALNDNGNGNKLIFLERIVLFSCFAVIIHLSSRVLDISGKYKKEDRIPLLFDADGTLETIKFASQETLLFSRLGLEEYFEKTLELILKEEQYHKLTLEEILEKIEETPLADSSKKKNLTSEDEKRDDYKKLFLGFYEQSEDAFDSFIKATRFLIFSNVYSTDPSVFISALGGKIGLLAPRAGGRGRKRFSPDPIILEIIILSILKKGEKLQLSEFGKRLWEQYGIIIGANPEEDLKQLDRWNLSQNTPGDLAGGLTINAEKIADIYISMGYGRRYADGVTMLSI